MFKALNLALQLKSVLVYRYFDSFLYHSFPKDPSMFKIFKRFAKFDFIENKKDI